MRLKPCRFNLVYYREEKRREGRRWGEETEPGLREWEQGWVMAWKRGKHAASWHLCVCLCLFPSLCLLLILFILTFFPLYRLSLFTLVPHFLSIPLFQSILVAILCFFCFLSLFFFTVLFSEPARQPYKVLLHHTHTRTHTHAHTCWQTGQWGVHFAGV